MIWVRIAGGLMFAVVLLGAFGSHALKDRLDPSMIEIYKTAVLYHMVHALGLLAVAWLSTYTSDSKLNFSGIAFVIGIVLFSGSLYLLSLTGMRWLGAITPLGGLCFLAGWFCLMLVKFKV